jgi:hypothetical protein
MPPRPTRLEQTETEYLLYIPPSQKERAKGIPDWWWDGDRGCWQYPRNLKAYNALIAEFGDELVGGIAITPPDGVAPVETEIQTEVSAIREALLALSDTQPLQSALLDKEAELIALRHQISQLQQQVHEQESQLQEQSDLIQQLRSQSENGKAKTSKADLQQYLLHLVKEASGNHPQFIAILDQLKFNSSLPIELVKVIESVLRELVKGAPADGIHDLLTQARDQGIFQDDRALDLAHLIRKQRNLIAHSTVDPKSTSAIVILCLCAAGLMWRDLPVDVQDKPKSTRSKRSKVAS